MNVLLPQTIETEAVALLESANCTITTAADPKPETVFPLIKNAHGLILRTGIHITRDLIENPRLIEKRLRRKLHTNVQTNKENIRKIEKKLKNLRVIRSFELVKIAFELGYLDKYMLEEEKEVVPNLKRAVLEGVLWAIKLSGCSVRGEDIIEVLKNSSY